MKTELWTEEVGDFAIKLYGKTGGWTFFCLPTWQPQYKYMEMFLTLTAVTLAFYSIST